MYIYECASDGTNVCSLSEGSSKIGRTNCHAAEDTDSYLVLLINSRTYTTLYQNSHRCIVALHLLRLVPFVGSPPFANRADAAWASPRVPNPLGLAPITDCVYCYAGASNRSSTFVS